MTVRPLRLRTIVALLVIASILPLAGLAGWLIWQSWQTQRELVARQSVEQARAISTAVDQSVDRTIAALQVLATLEPIDEDDRSHFTEIASRMLRLFPGWDAVRLVDLSMNVVADTRGGTGPLQPLVNPDWVKMVIETRRPAVSTVRQDPVTGQWMMTIGIPVSRDGALKYALGARLRASAFGDIIARQKVPEGGVVTLLDSTPIIVSRSRNPERYNGQGPTADLIEHWRTGAEGSWRSRMLEGTASYSAWSRSAATGLTVVIGVPMTTVDRPIMQSFMALGAIALFVMGSGLALALLLSRGIVRAQTSAVTAARALARGEPLPTFRSHVAEAHDLLAGLREADAILQRRLEERDAAQAEADRQRTGRFEREQAARRAAEALSRAQEEFVATVSHELRTPLNAIVGWVAMLKTGTLDPGKQAHALDVIDRNARAQAQLVEDLLDMSRVIRGTVRLDLQPTDLARVLATTVESLRPTADTRKIALTLNADGRDAVVAADRHRIEQVLYNLLANALKFTPQGGRVQVALAVEDEQAVVRIVDTGEGIAAEFLPHVFDRFRQETGDATRVHSGLGIGLSLVQSLTELHGGSVSAESPGKGQGATFTLRLPLVSSSLRAPGQWASAT